MKDRISNLRRTRLPRPIRLFKVASRMLRFQDLTPEEARKKAFSVMPWMSEYYASTLNKTVTNPPWKDKYFIDLQSTTRLQEYQFAETMKTTEGRTLWYLAKGIIEANKPLDLERIEELLGTSFSKSIRVERRSFSDSELRIACDESDWQCHWCGSSLNEENRPIADHLVPVARGGKTIQANCIPSCWRCNSKRSDKSAALFRYECRIEGSRGRKLERGSK